MLKEIATLKQCNDDLKNQLAHKHCTDEMISDCEEVSYLDWICRIPGLNHISELVLSSLDSKSLANCRQVSKSLKKMTHGKNYTWSHIVNNLKLLENGEGFLGPFAEYEQEYG